MPERDRQAVRQLIRSVRLRAGLTQQDVAARLGLPQSYISKCESGERRVDVIELNDICRACGTDLLSFVQELTSLFEDR